MEMIKKNQWLWAFVLLFASGCNQEQQSQAPRQDNQVADSSSDTASSSPKQPTVKYWHAWTDEKGVSHQTRCEVTAFDFKSISPGAAPSWIDKLITSGATVLVVVQPVGWVGEWHENPKPQWIIPLSGRWFVETMDGTRVEMGPGEISFGNDQDTKPDAQGRRGHRSGTIGNEPSINMIVQFDQGFPKGKPCPFK